MIVIDGCEIGCGKATLQGAGVPLPRHRHLVITEYGIAKNKDFNLSEEDVDLVKQAVKNATSQPASGTRPAARAPVGGGGCCS